MRFLKATQEVFLDRNLLSWLPLDEEVKIIPGTHYAISETGRVFSGKKWLEYKFINGERNSFPSWKEMQVHQNNGYWAVNLNIEGKKTKFYLHDLIFSTFRGEYSKYYFKIVYLDGCKDNVHVDNLALRFRSARVRGEYIYRTQFTGIHKGIHEKYIVNFKK